MLAAVSDDGHVLGYLNMMPDCFIMQRNMNIRGMLFYCMLIYTPLDTERAFTFVIVCIAD